MRTAVTVEAQRPAASTPLVNTAGKFLILLGALGLVGVLLVIVSTRWGPFLSDDSYYYVAPAREWVAGSGFHPTRIFAPLLPFLLGLLHFLGPDPLLGGQGLNAILFGVNIVLTGLIVRRMGASYGFAALASLAVLLTDVLIEIHGWLMSEALSFTFILLALFFTQSYLQDGHWRSWLGSAAACSLAFLTRYAAVSIIPAVALVLLIYAPLRRWQARLPRAVLFGAVALLPGAAYLLRNLALTGHPFHYQNYFLVPFTRDQLTWFFYNTLSYFVPGRFLRGREILAGGLATGLVIGLLLAYFILARRRLRERNIKLASPGLMLMVSILAWNLLMLIVARGLTELDVYNPRYLLPMLLVTLMIMAYLFGQVWQIGGRPLRIAIAVFWVAFLVYYGYRSLDYLRLARDKGIGYLNIGWHNSETIPYLLEHPDIDLVATADMAVYFWTGHLPAVITAYGGAQGLHESLCQSGATLVIFDQMPVEMYHMTPDEVIDGLTLVRSFNDSQMFQCTQ